MKTRNEYAGDAIPTCIKAAIAGGTTDAVTYWLRSRSGREGSDLAGDVIGVSVISGVGAAFLISAGTSEGLVSRAVSWFRNL